MTDAHDGLEARVSALESVARQLQAEIDELKKANQVGRPAEAPTTRVAGAGGGLHDQRQTTRTPTRTGYPKS